MLNSLLAGCPPWPPTSGQDRWLLSTKRDWMRYELNIEDKIISVEADACRFCVNWLVISLRSWESPFSMHCSMSSWPILEFPRTLQGNNSRERKMRKCCSTAMSMLTPMPEINHGQRRPIQLPIL